MGSDRLTTWRNGCGMLTCDVKNMLSVVSLGNVCDEARFPDLFERKNGCLKF